MRLYLQREDITFHIVFFLIAAVGPFIPDMSLFSALTLQHEMSTAYKWTEGNKISIMSLLSHQIPGHVKLSTFGPSPETGKNSSLGIGSHF